MLKKYEEQELWKIFKALLNVHYVTNEVDLSSKKIYNSEKIYLIGDVKNMKNILENDIEKELDNIYGIENSKWEILNYAKYLEISS